LSAAVPESDSVDEEVARAPDAVGAVIVTVGAVVSDVVAVDVTVRMSVPAFPAASRAVIVITLVPDCKPMEGTLQLVVPVVLPLPPRLLTQLTEVTPTLSEAVPLRDTFVPAVVYPPSPVGDAITTVGGVVSAVVPAATVHVKA
jgi:hypothetical protein